MQTICHLHREKIMWSGFRRKNGVEMRVDLVMHPYKYMRRYDPKEGKNREKVHFYFLKSSYMIGGVCKTIGYGV